MAKKTVVASEEVAGLHPNVSFDDAQITAIAEAGLEPGQVRNELGLSLLKENELITLEEAIVRATAKYKV